jgi:hypothetical protein
MRWIASNIASLPEKNVHQSNEEQAANTFIAFAACSSLL